MICLRSISAVTWGCCSIVSVMGSSFASVPGREAPDVSDEIMKFLDRHRRRAEQGLARRHVANHAGLRADTRAIADGQMAGKASLPSDHDIIAEPRTARDADLRH